MSFVHNLETSKKHVFIFSLSSHKMFDKIIDNSQIGEPCENSKFLFLTIARFDEFWTEHSHLKERAFTTFVMRLGFLCLCTVFVLLLLKAILYLGFYIFPCVVCFEFKKHPIYILVHNFILPSIKVVFSFKSTNTYIYYPCYIFSQLFLSKPIH